ncbi:Malto-oligosyltrehalose trehalohydrolase [Gossypium arboreum]|uniref:Malto-oligosyltrehalose trehalohydrolase n=1 Tax=Gossypium arboreum TaxID=29729 RepID=A0A0B0NY14_GOSAR|nr:Malto-oligosyltrehalose trehalohydrolase [Gossypium arboreum]
MWFGSKERVPEPTDSSIFTHYRLIWIEFSSGEYISLWPCGDENLTKT